MGYHSRKACCRTTGAVLLGAVLAAGELGAQAGVATIGTLEATVQGETRTWYVVTGQAIDGDYASGGWLSVGENEIVVTIAGFDTPDPPVHTFEKAPPSLGDYDGTSMGVIVPFPPGGGPASFTIPSNGETGADVVYVARPTLDDFSALFTLVEGSIEVESSEMAGGHVRVRGTFSGVLEAMDQSARIEITGGRFQAEGLPSIRDLAGS